MFITSIEYGAIVGKKCAGVTFCMLSVRGSKWKIAARMLFTTLS